MLTESTMCCRWVAYRMCMALCRMSITCMSLRRNNFVCVYSRQTDVRKDEL